MSCFESMRKLLMSRLEERGELTDEEILEIIDELVLSRSREFLLTLKEKEGLRKDLFYSVRKLDVLQELVEDNTVTDHGQRLSGYLCGKRWDNPEVGKIIYFRGAASGRDPTDCRKV